MDNHNAQSIHVGVLALQGAFSEHVQLLSRAMKTVQQDDKDGISWSCTEVRTSEQLSKCDALIIPGGESTTMSLVAARSGLLEALRTFVKSERKPTWGTCAGLILLAEAANRTKKGGQELIGGIDVRVNRNHFGRQTESFTTNLDLAFLNPTSLLTPHGKAAPFKAMFIRAPVVERILPQKDGIQDEEVEKPETVVAPSQPILAPGRMSSSQGPVEVMATLPNRDADGQAATGEGDIVAVRQGNCFGTSFHPELTNDERIHIWWLQQVRQALSESKGHP